MRSYRKILNEIKPYVSGMPIEDVKRMYKLKDVYKLASNENPFVPAFVQKAVLKELKNINRYPQSDSFALANRIADKFDVDIRQVIFGNGSDELIVMALRTFIDQDDEVIVAYPTFLMYELQARVCGAKVVKVPLKDYRYDLDTMLAAVTDKTKIIFIANPVNPTGTYLTHSEIEVFLSKVPEDILVFLDEAYYEFAPKDFPDSRRLMERYSNVIIARTFSKVYGLAGLRIGYGITNIELVAVMNKVRDPFNVNRMAQAAAKAVLDNPGFVEKVVKFTVREKKYIYAELDRMGIIYLPSATNFITIDFKKDTKDLFDFFIKKGLIVRPLSGWGLPNFFRVTVGLRKENVKFIKLLKKYVKSK